MLPGILLAAGESSRTAPLHKLLVPFRGKPIVRHALAAALAAQLTHVVVVLGHQAADVRAALGSLAADPRVVIVYNRHWSRGRAGSLRCGLATLGSDVPGALFCTGDMPLLSAPLIDAVAESCVRTGAPSFPLYGGEKGHPVAFPHAWFARLRALRGDESAFALICAHWEAAAKLPRTDVHTQLNANTPAALRQLEAMER